MFESGPFLPFTRLGVEVLSSILKREQLLTKGVQYLKRRFILAHTVSSSAFGDYRISY